MNGIHDMGGMHGLGPIELEKNEPVFHQEWERRTFALTLACGFLGRWNLDMSRSAREQMDAAEYLSTSYYEHWLFGLERLLGQSGLLSPGAPTGGLRVLRGDEVEKALRDPRGARVDLDLAPRYKVGDRVRARNLNPVGHTRLPRYCRGKQGVVHLDQGVWVFPDAHSAGEGKKPQRVYSVRFPATELWGPAASPRDSVHVDLWDDYLEPA
jgi:nitrile hydratase